MSQTVPASVQLGFAYAGAAGIGYRVLRLDRSTVVVAFTTTGVVEAPANSGQFQVTGGHVAHDEGGYRVWGTSGTDILWSDIPPSAVDALTEYDAATVADTEAIADAIEALGASASITLVNVVDGETVTVYRNDTWHFTPTIGGGIVLTDYEAVALVVKRSVNQTDDDALLYVRSDTGLIRIGGAEPSASSAGSLTVPGATTFTVHVDITETDVTPGQYFWWLKVFETGTTPDEGYTRAEGTFVVENYGLRAVA
jgi:hypothetical protein